MVYCSHNLIYSWYSVHITLSTLGILFTQPYLPLVYCTHNLVNPCLGILYTQPYLPLVYCTHTTLSTLGILHITLSTLGILYTQPLSTLGILYAQPYLPLVYCTHIPLSTHDILYTHTPIYSWFTVHTIASNCTSICCV